MDKDSLSGTPQISPLRQKCSPCPFCGSIPYVALGKKGSCQLHGEPFQSVRIYCKGINCRVHPSMEAGDIYDGGEAKAREEAIKIWNRRAA